MGIMQHHDAVTGTEKQPVADDYVFLLNRAIDLCGSNTWESLNQLTIAQDNQMRVRSTGFNPNDRFDFDTCSNLNISTCEISENNDKFIVTVYNPLAHSTFQYVRVPVAGGNTEYIVKDYRDVQIVSQLVPIPEEVQTLQFRISNSRFELVFLASELPPLGYKSYFIEKMATNNKSIEPKVIFVLDAGFQSDQPISSEAEESDLNAPVTIGNKFVNVTFDKNGLLHSLRGNGQSINVKQNFYVYEAAAGNNEIFQNRSSGAYIFRPNVTEAEPITSRATIRVINGPVVDEVHQKFNDWISQVVRVNKEENVVEFEWMVGGIPVADDIGREIISRFDTDIQTKGIFYTDSNGREMMRRQRDHRDTWNLTLLEKISGNYYPVTAKIVIEDEQKRFAVLTDRAQGGSSMTDGSIELMVDIHQQFILLTTSHRLFTFYFL